MPAKTTTAHRMARNSWRLQYRDSRQSLELAEEAYARAAATGDVGAEGWARVSRGFYRMRYATPAEAEQELVSARRCFEAVQDRTGEILTTVGIGRCWWIQGRSRDALDLVLPLRAEGLHVLKQVERGMLLNVIAGCYSSLGQSAEAFAYLFQALRESSGARSHGFDVVLFCNLAHELYHLGDYDVAISYIEEGITRCTELNNARLLSVLLVNRIVCLNDLNRPKDAMPDVHRLLELPADESGRGSHDAAFETMAIAALRAGETALGNELIERAKQTVVNESIPDKKIEFVVAVAEGFRARRQWNEAAAHLEAALPLPADGLSLRARCLFFQTLADAYEQIGNSTMALRYLRSWQEFHVERTHRASQARYQAASLQTELLKMQRQRDDIEARRRSSERAKAELETINQKLSHKVREVQALQAELKQQAVRDFLTGLFNRRHLNDVMPSMLALAERHDEPLAVAIIDLDHFKSVNDAHGHVAGDMLLAAFGGILTDRMRRSDVACRYGGEEFCVLMPRTDAQAARRKMESLLKLWRSSVFTVKSGPGEGAIAGNTFSAGVADSKRAPGSVEALLHAADRGVLEAKRLGRDRVVDAC